MESRGAPSPKSERAINDDANKRELADELRQTKKPGEREKPRKKPRKKSSEAEEAQKEAKRSRKKRQ